MKRYYYVLLVLIAGFILCYLGFFNNYPLMHSDSGTYIKSGFLNQVPPDRPIFYGLFVRHISMAESLYFVIITQGILLALLFLYYFRYFLPDKNPVIPFLGFIFLITFFTGASLNVSQVIPDIFTPITILGLGLLFLVNNLKVRDLVIISILVFLGIAVHNSHLLIAAGLLIISTFLYAFRKIRTKWTFLSWRRLAYLWLLLIGTNLVISTVNFAFGSEFKSSRGGHVFLMSRLIDTGILKQYLDDKCGEVDYKFCEYKDQIPWDFIWDFENSPLYKTGGWEGNEEEYKKIIFDALTTPKYLKIFIIKGLESSFNQFFTFETGNAKQMLKGSAPYSVIDRFFKDQLKEYVGSRQSRKVFNFNVINTSQLFLFAFSLFVIIVILILRFPLKWKILAGFFLVSVYMNALVCGAFSFVAPRYQSRVVWLLILPVFMILTEYRQFMGSILNRKDNQQSSDQEE